MTLAIILTLMPALAGDGEITRAIHEIFPGLDQGAIIVRNGQGRVVIDPANYFSYFVFTANPTESNPTTVLIPMATSRFSGELPLDGSKQSITRQVLSNNPPVFFLGQMPPKSTPLQTFLLEALQSRDPTDAYHSFYRGAEKPDELTHWKKGKTPKGVRYLTPDATYAWRYARKNPRFLDLLVDGEAPLFGFRIPKAEFAEAVRRGEVVLGTEMTARAHGVLESRGRFEDHLLPDAPYLGSPEWGVEIEVHTLHSAAQKLPKTYVGPITIDQLVASRTKQLQAGYSRLLQQTPQLAHTLETELHSKLDSLRAEAELMHAVAEGRFEKAEDLLKSGIRHRQITQIDGVDLSAWINDRRNTAQTRARAQCIKGTLGGQP
jgi:hypothetical protein